LECKYPSEKQIDSLSKKAMDIIDIDGSETIDFDEFCNWIKNDEEI
jgi:Ca2+-binding EF-hand superfamily protein